MLTTFVSKVSIKKLNHHEMIDSEDQLAVEEPLEIRCSYFADNRQITRSISVTMRTPGNDEALAAGFLFTEGIINNRSQVSSINIPSFPQNNVLVSLHENATPVLSNAERNFYTTSSCGVCGKASIDSIKTVSVYTNNNDEIFVQAKVFYNLHDQLKEQQVIFQSTGGLHAAALFNLGGNFIMLREDVGRHNALDKLIGTALLNNQLPLSEHILLLSGRASFELLQKAMMAGIKIVAAVGAPSSLAVDLAREGGITLIGFLRGERFNIYSASQRVKLSQ
jgi:FdhD protein